MVLQSLESFGVGTSSASTWSPMEADEDFEQIRELEFPCFAAERSALTGYCRVTEVNIPVTLTGQDDT